MVMLRIGVGVVRVGVVRWKMKHTEQRWMKKRGGTMTLEEIKNRSSSYPAEVQQVIWELVAMVEHLDGLIGDRDAEISRAVDFGIEVGRCEAFLEAAEMAEAYANKHREIVARRIAAALRQRAEEEK